MWEKKLDHLRFAYCHGVIESVLSSGSQHVSIIQKIKQIYYLNFGHLQYLCYEAHCVPRIEELVTPCSAITTSN